MNHEDQAKLHRQVERSSLFTHTALSRLSSRINEIDSFLYAVIDMLIQKGILTSAELTQAVELVRQELVEKAEDFVALRINVSSLFKKRFQKKVEQAKEIVEDDIKRI